MYTHVRIYVCIYIYNHGKLTVKPYGQTRKFPDVRFANRTYLEWHYLSNATCQIRPHLCYACFVVSRTTMICCFLRHA